MPFHRRSTTRGRALLALCSAAALALAAAPATCLGQERIAIDDAIRMARERNPGLVASHAARDAADAAVRTARQYPNPELAGLAGGIRRRTEATNQGLSSLVAISQPVEYPFVRSARRRVADAGLEAAEARARQADAELVAEVRLAYVETALAHDLVEMAGGQVALLERARRGVAAAVEAGEAPGLDLSSAETALLEARADDTRVAANLQRARRKLATTIGLPPHHDFTVDPHLPQLELDPRERLLERLRAENAELESARRESERARSTLVLERALRWPDLALDAEWEREPDDNKVRVGLSLPLPLWNRRGGEIAEAQAEVARVNALYAEQLRRLELELNEAYSQYVAAREQVSLIQDGLLERALEAQRGAEAAYSSGERGILAYLDAQRTVMRVRIELFTARVDQYRAKIEIERMLWTP